MFKPIFEIPLIIFLKPRIYREYYRQIYSSGTFSPSVPVTVHGDLHWLLAQLLIGTLYLRVCSCVRCLRFRFC